MYYDQEFEEPLLQDVELEDVGTIEEDEWLVVDLENESLDQIPNLPERLRQFLEQSGLSEEDLARVNLSHDKLLDMLKSSPFQFLNLISIDNFLFKLIISPFLGKDDVKVPSHSVSFLRRLVAYPYTRVWPRSKSLLIESPRVLMQTYMATDFLNGMSSFSVGMALALSCSFAINELVNLVICMQTRDSLKVNGLILDTLLGPLIGYRGSRSFSIVGILLPILLGPSLVWGICKALTAALDAKPLTEKRVQRLINTLQTLTLQSQEPQIWQDSLRWLLPLR